MNSQEKELKIILNEGKIETINIFQYGTYIITEDKEIEITANDDKPIIKVIDRENT